MFLTASTSYTPTPATNAARIKKVKVSLTRRGTPLSTLRTRSTYHCFHYKAHPCAINNRYLYSTGRRWVCKDRFTVRSGCGRTRVGTVRAGRACVAQQHEFIACLVSAVFVIACFTAATAAGADNLGFVS